MAQQLDMISDDMSITRGLLGRPDIPLRRTTSFASTSRSDHTREVSNERDKSAGLKDDGRRRRMIQSSNTWTALSGEVFSEKDDVEDRTFFTLEYNRLATKHGVRTLIPEDSDPSYAESGNRSNKSGSWFSGKILRRTSSTQSVKLKPDRLTKHRRSISNLSLRLKSKSDTLKDKDLQELVRLCGLSLLYLPTEYAASSLAVPTCFRATAQYLVQHASTARGVFRIPGSHNTVAALYNHYCTMDEHGAVVAGTVRCPTLPDHIRYDVHDVASAFKKFLSGLPGGILGSLPLFDAFISIQSQLNSVPELTRTKQSKVRARLIALAIATLRSQYRRELICAVFGLLSMIGRAAETAPRENERGRPLPTSDLMGYGPLGIVFGPLLVGDLLENYTMRLANPHGGLVLLPISPPKSRKERSKKNKTSEDCSVFNTHVDKIKIANSITEMLITHWRDVVRHMKNLKALKIVRSYKSLEATASKQPFLRPSASESFALRKPPHWDNDNSPMRQVKRCESPTPAGRGGGLLESRLSGHSSPKSNDTLTVRKQRSRPRPMSSQMLSGARSMSFLSPTKEENAAECSPESDGPSGQGHISIPPPTRSNKEIYQFSDYTRAASLRTYDVPLNSPANALIADGSQPVQEHELKDCPPPAMPQLLQEYGLKDCPPPAKLKDCSPAAKSKYLLKQTRLMGPREPEPLSPRKPYPGIILSRAPSPGQAKPVFSALRRISASEPGFRPKMPIQRPLRPSKSTYGDSAHRISVQDWAAPRDPLARVSAAEDIASLAALAHVLEEEPLETGVEVRFATEEVTTVQKQIKEPDEHRERPTQLTQRIIELGSVHENENKPRLSTNTPTRCKPGAIEGPNYGYLSKRTPSPKKRDSVQVSPRPGSPASVKHSSSWVTLVKTSSVEVQIENSQVAVNESPRVSVKALVAKFNNSDSRSLSAPSPTKSFSKTISVDIRAVSDSPREKIIAPYTTNPPSPTKSQKSGISGVSVHSVRIPPPVDRAVAKASPPRRLLRSDLNDSTPLRTVPERSSASASQPPDSPACCSPPGSLQCLSLYDGPSVQISGQPSSELILCPLSPHVHFEPKRTTAAPEGPNSNESPSIPMAINPLTNLPPTRSNSILHAQIRTLQQLLNRKTEEVQHLKRQLGTRENLNIGALSEELREAKKETQVWKNRAEVAEKQLQVMAALSSRTTSSQTTTNSSSMAAEHSDSAPSRTGYSENGAVASARIIRALHGMDGANSNPSSSESSTDTVVHDVREEAATGSEYSGWNRQ